MQEIEFVKMVERMHIPKEPYEDAPIGQVLAKDIPTAGVEELDSDVLDLLRAFQAETNEQKRLKDLEIGLKNFRPAQRSQFLSALSWLPDEQKVSDLLAVVLSGDSSSAGKVRAQFMKMIRENWTNPAANPETVLRILLGRMSWDKSAEIARDFMRIVIRELISTGATDPALPGVVGIAAAESTIRNFREQAQLNSRDFYHRLALAHELIADAYGKIAALGPNRQEIEQSQRVEQAYLFLYEAIAQTILAEGPNARAILRLIGQGNGHASYEFAKQILEPLILSQDPHERLMALSRLAELEQTYADLLMLTRRIEFQPSEHYVRAVQFREQHKTLILERRQVLGLAPSTGLEEGDSSKDRLKSSQISFNGLIAAAREHGIEAFEIYKDRDDPRPATLAAKMAGNPLTDPDAVRGLEFEMRRIFGDEVDRQTYYLRIGAKEGWDGIWAEVVANAGLEEEWDRRVSDYYQGASVAVLGGRGFVGSRYLQQLLSQWAGVVGEVKAITTQELQRFRDQVEDLPGLSKLTLVRGNHLDLTDVRELIRGAKVVMDTAGLAWQHLPGGRPAALTDELLQNGISAVLIGQALGRDQRLVWSSSNAGDYMFARLSEGDARALSVEIDHRARRYVNWVRSLGERVPTRDKLTSFVEQDLHALPPGKFSKGPANPEEVAYAEQSSYAYSKLLGERILEIIGREDGKDIRVLKISDVYGPGQGLGPPIWDARQSPRQAARRIQRFMAVYEAIRAQGYQPWQLTAAGHADGFSEADGQIQQKIFDDSVAPTYIDDVVQMMHRAAAADLPAGKVVLSVSGPWISNAEMVKTIADVVGLEKDLGRTVRFVNGPPILAKQPNPADGDLGLLGMKDILTPFEEGIGRHLAWWRAQSAGVEELPVTPAIFAGMMDHTNLTWGADKAAIEPSAGGLEEKAEGGLLEIPSVVEAKKVLILAPEALRMLGALAWLQPADGQPIPLVALAENADQAGEIRRWASDLGLNAEVIDVSAAPYEGNVPQALQMISRYYASENGLIPLVVRDLEALLEVAKFLGVAEPESFARMAEAAISEQVGQYL